MDIEIRKSDEELHRIYDLLFLQVKEVADDLKAVRSIWGAWYAAKSVVRHVQIIGEQYALLGAEKKELAVQLILDIIPDRWISDRIARPFVGLAVEVGYREMKKAGPAALNSLKDLISKRLG